MAKLHRTGKAYLGCIAAVAVVVAIALGIFVASLDDPEPAPSAALSRPQTIIDSTLLPVLNVDFRFDRPVIGRDLIVSVAEATRDVGGQLYRSPAEGRSLTAVNVSVTRSVAGREGVMLLHFTIPAPALLAAAREGRPAAAFLDLTNEAGLNAVEVERAVRDYCTDPAVAFCKQALR